MDSIFSLKGILVFVIFLPVLGLNAQSKFERETRIDKQEAPAKAIDFIDRSDFNSKIKWYKEISQEGKSFEAKTRRKGHKFSIEFDTAGNVLDVEKEVKLVDIDTELIQKIEKSLTNEFTKFKIVKIQLQWKADDEVLIELINTDNTSNKVSVRYEIVVKGKKEGFSKFYELLLDDRGKVLRTLEILDKNTDILMF